jgi:hypothetical protein
MPPFFPKINNAIARGFLFVDRDLKRITLSRFLGYRLRPNPMAIPALLSLGLWLVGPRSVSQFTGFYSTWIFCTLCFAATGRGVVCFGTLLSAIPALPTREKFKHTVRVFFLGTWDDTVRALLWAFVPVTRGSPAALLATPFLFFLTPFQRHCWLSRLLVDEMDFGMALALLKSGLPFDGELEDRFWSAARNSAFLHPSLAVCLWGPLFEAAARQGAFMTVKGEKTGFEGQMRDIIVSAHATVVQEHLGVVLGNSAIPVSRPRL